VVVGGEGGGLKGGYAGVGLRSCMAAGTGASGEPVFNSGRVGRVIQLR
jgi:hypothetical protein